MLVFFLALIVVWSAGLTFFVYTTRAHYHSLIAKTKKGTIDEILKVLLKKDDVFSEQIRTLQKYIATLIEQEKLHYQKIGFVRFNPFERVGGEQSFIITLLNQSNSGIILNFLYTREGIRVFAKKVEKGVGEEYELSSEEKTAIQKAR